MSRKVTRPTRGGARAAAVSSRPTASTGSANGRGRSNGSRRGNITSSHAALLSPSPPPPATAQSDAQLLENLQAHLQQQVKSLTSVQRTNDSITTHNLTPLFSSLKGYTQRLSPLLLQDLFTKLRQPNSKVRYLTLQVLHTLLERSKHIRAQVFTSDELLSSIFQLTLGVRQRSSKVQTSSADVQLPLPAEYRTLLRTYSKQCIERWWYMYGGGKLQYNGVQGDSSDEDASGETYVLLRLGYEYLRDTCHIQFPNIVQTGLTLTEQQQARQQQRTNQILLEKYQQFCEEYSDVQQEVQSVLQEINSVLDILCPELVANETVSSGISSDIPVLSAPAASNEQIADVNDDADVQWEDGEAPASDTPTDESGSTASIDALPEGLQSSISSKPANGSTTPTSVSDDDMIDYSAFAATTANAASNQQSSVSLSYRESAAEQGVHSNADHIEETPENSGMFDVLRDQYPQLQNKYLSMFNDWLDVCMRVPTTTINSDNTSLSSATARATALTAQPAASAPVSQADRDNRMKQLIDLRQRVIRVIQTCVSIGVTSRRKKQQYVDVLSDEPAPKMTAATKAPLEAPASYSQRQLQQTLSKRAHSSNQQPPALTTESSNDQATDDVGSHPSTLTSIVSSTSSTSPNTSPSKQKKSSRVGKIRDYAIKRSRFIDGVVDRNA